MKYAMIILLLVVGSGCASGPIERTKYTDPAMRVAIDPEGLYLSSYSRIQHALVQSGTFQVVDRSRGLSAALREQGMQHEEQRKRFGKSDRYAELGRLYGVGGVIVGDIQCQRFVGNWSGQPFSRCHQNLALVSATTGEVIAVGEADVETEPGAPVPSWEKAARSLADNMPKRLLDRDAPHDNIEYKKNMREHRRKLAQAAEEADSQREKE